MVASFAAIHCDMSCVSAEAGNGSVLCANRKLTRPQSTHARKHCDSWLSQWKMWAIVLLLLVIVKCEVIW